PAVASRSKSKESLRPHSDPPAQTPLANSRSRSPPAEIRPVHRKADSWAAADEVTSLPRCFLLPIQAGRRVQAVSRCLTTRDGRRHNPNVLRKIAGGRRDEQQLPLHRPRP